MKNVLLYIWQLPQNLLGLILLLIYKPESRLTYKGVKVFFNQKFPSGISLGNYVILRKEPKNDYDYTWIDIYHEYGHHRQSLYLGWFYLPVIGLPSLLGNLWDRWAHAEWSYYESYEWYYKQPWEHWADVLGGVERDRK